MAIEFQDWRGSKNRHAKLDEAKVSDMRKKSMDGWTRQQLADHFGVSKQTVSRIVRYELWAPGSGI